jgi:hypothetical protein
MRYLRGDGIYPGTYATPHPHGHVLCEECGTVTLGEEGVPTNCPECQRPLDPAMWVGDTAWRQCECEPSEDD